MPNEFRVTTDKNWDFIPRVVGDKVWMCDSHDVLFLQEMGGLDTARSKFGFTSLGAERYEWITDGNIPRSADITANVAAPSSAGNDAFGYPVYTTDTSITVDHPEYFFHGMIIMADDPAGAAAPEQMWVSSVNETTGVLTVVRGWRGSPVYAYTASNPDHKVCVSSVAAEECHPFVSNYMVKRDYDYNYIQTFTAGISISDRFERLAHYGVENEYQRQMTKIMGGTLNGRKISGELPRALEQAVLYGNGAPGNVPTFKGINAFGINQVAVTNITYQTISDALEHAMMQGADVGNMTIVTSPSIQNVISGWTTGVINEDVQRGTVGRTVSNIMTNWGTLPVKWHRHMRPNEMYIVDFAEMGLIEIEEFNEFPLARTNAFCRDVQIKGTYGFALACPCHHTRIRVTNECIETDPCVGPGCFEEPVYVPQDEPGVVDA